MQLYQMQYFITLSKVRNFSNAAKMLYLTPPALSIAIKKLETELGVILINREKRTFALTEAGEVFLSAAQCILKNVEELHHDLASLENAVQLVTIAALHTVCSDPFFKTISEFSEYYPNTQVNIRRCNSGQSVYAFVKDNPGCFGIAPKMSAHENRIDCQHCCSVEYGLFFPHSYTNIFSSTITAQELSVCPVGIINASEDLLWNLHSDFPSLEAAIHPSNIVVLHPESAKRIVEAGLGTAILPLNLEDNRFDLVVRRFSPRMIFQYEYIWCKGTPLLPQQRQLFEFLNNNVPSLNGD
ncbi:MAG: LysR family transcriptional regulator [Tannerellaceae bacterium]|nr:LysR family transcriptional regulator [Tannerellaceae bacterium]